MMLLMLSFFFMLDSLLGIIKFIRLFSVFIIFFKKIIFMLMIDKYLNFIDRKYY